MVQTRRRKQATLERLELSLAQDSFEFASYNMKQALAPDKFEKGSREVAAILDKELFISFRDPCAMLSAEGRELQSSHNIWRRDTSDWLQLPNPLLPRLSIRS